MVAGRQASAEIMNVLDFFSLLVRQNAKSESLNRCQGLFLRSSVGQCAGNVRNLGYPATVFFLFKLNLKSGKTHS